jgi:hypothetical protein
LAECPFKERDERRRAFFEQFAIDANKPGPLGSGGVSVSADHTKPPAGTAGKETQ